MKTYKKNTLKKEPTLQIVLIGKEKIKRFEELRLHISELCGENMTARGTVNWISKQFEKDKVVFNV